MKPVKSSNKRGSLSIPARLVLASIVLTSSVFGVNPGGTTPPNKNNGTTQAGSDQPQSPSAGKGSDCDGSKSASDPNSAPTNGNGGSSSCSGCGNDPNSPAAGQCIKEFIPLGLNPNEPDLDAGKIQLYIDATGTNLASRQYLSYFALDQMNLEPDSPTLAGATVNIVQAGGTSIGFEIPKTSSITNSSVGFVQASGKPMGASASSQARLLPVSSSGSIVPYGSASSIRHYRGASGGAIDYPKNGGLARKYTTTEGRSYTFPMTGIEVIRQKTDLTLVVNGSPKEGMIRQVKTAAGMLDVVTINERCYEIRKYAPSQIGTKVDGIYQALSAAYYTMRVEAPEGTLNQLIITKTEGSITSVSTNTITVEKTAVPNPAYDPNPILVGPGSGNSKYQPETVDVIKEKWLQINTMGEFSFERVLDKTKDPRQGPSYLLENRTARMVSSPGQTYPEQSMFTRLALTYKFAPVDVSDNLNGETSSRMRSFDSVDWDPNGIGEPISQTTTKGTSYSYSYNSARRMQQMSIVRGAPSGGGGGGGGSPRPTVMKALSYEPHGIAGGATEVLQPADFRPRTEETKEGNVVVGRKMFSATTINGEYTERTETVTNLNAGWNHSSNLVLEKKWYGPGDHQGRLKSELAEDGTFSRYEYTAKPNNQLEVITYSQITPAGAPVSGHSLRDTELRDARGWPIENRSAVFTGGTWVDYQKITRTYNEAGRLLVKQRIDLLSGQVRQLLAQEWDGPNLIRKTDEDGISTQYVYFPGTKVLKQEIREEIPAAGTFAAQAAITTTYSGNFTIDEQQNPVWHYRISTITGGGLTLTKSEAFLAGKVVSETDFNGNITSTSYSENDKLMIQLLPNGGTRIVRKDSDGDVLSISGTTVVPEFYHYDPVIGGGRSTTVYYGIDNGPRWVKTFTDAAGRVVRTEKPTSSGGVWSEVKTYSPQFPQSVVKISRTGEGDTLYTLDAMGTVNGETRTGSIANTNDDIRTSSDMSHEQDTAGLWSVVKSYVCPEAGSSTSKLVGTSRRKLAGFVNGEISIRQQLDVSGNITSSIFSRSGLLAELHVSKPGVTGDEINHYYGNRLQDVVLPGISGARSYGYDALGRETSRKEPRHSQASTTTYVADQGLVASQTDAAGNVTAFTYDSMGRVSSITLADQSVKYIAYTLRGEPMVEWGSQTYPTWKEYDAYGKLVTLRTWQVAPALNAGSLPASPPSGSTATTWAYEAATGLLSAKRYADGKGPDYAYDEAGRLMTRWWARQGSAGQRFASHYFWTDLGQLAGISYTDGITHDVSIFYDCLGRITEQGNGVAISAFTYSPATLRLNGETLTYDFDRDGTPELVRQLDRSQDTYLRSSGYQLRNGSTVEAEASYGYDSAGRIGSVSGGSLGTFNYSYEPASNLLAGVSGPAHTVTNTWEPNRDVLSLKENKVGTTVVSAYGYSVNSIGQRTASTQYGTAFASSRQIGWSYDALGQVTAADSSENAHDRVYEYDAIGNRVKSANSLTLPSQPNYASDVLNQYTAVDAVVPSYDEDGNATSYPLPASPSSSSTLTWDGENRLVSTTTNGVTTNNIYDSQSRRIAVTAGGITKVTVYDGWNPIADYVSGSLVRNYQWGQDLSGTLQGAGGVGGLLAISTGSQTYDPTYDGNGNVSEYLDVSGTVAAHFEYNPFGQTTVDTDSSGMFDIRFSTKRRDVETGLYYYGYRYYDPVTGRWPSRDPITENFRAGEYNAYAFVRNVCVGYFDLLGLILRPCDKSLPFQKDMINNMINNIKKNGSDENKKMIKQLEDSERLHTICFTSGPSGNTATDPDNESDPKTGSGTETGIPATGQDGFTPEETLVHELSHASEKDSGTIEAKVDGKRADNNGNGFSDTEDRAVKAQNSYSSAAGTGHYRTDYSDRNPAR